MAAYSESSAVAVELPEQAYKPFAHPEALRVAVAAAAVPVVAPLPVEVQLGHLVLGPVAFAARPRD